MKYFIPAHDFRAEEDVELSVHKGEVLCSTEGVAQDGWIKLEVATDARRRGFVPTSYLRELTATEAMELLETTGEHHDGGTAPSAAFASSPVDTPRRGARGDTSTAAAAGPKGTPSSTSLDVGNRSAVVQRTQSPSPRAASRSPNGGLSTAAATAPTNSPRMHDSKATMAGTAGSHPLTPAQQATGPISRHLLENPSAAVDAFMKNEVYFKQLMQRRASALAHMQSGIEEAMTEVAACKDRNTVLTRKLRDLDEVVERERERWVHRVEEEKAHVSRIAPYNSAMTVPASSGTTPVRSPISGRHGGPGRSVLEDNSPRQLRA
ncbi:SH3 domain protein-like protein [Leptomonas pyrrhocoris]|uniref:SH3 domain protein-like protein n=1 Tax=Leptomonas pyrrhocoris TaxID=157538 RepID=A0A0N0VGM3_LEPPY|nr:SH3 domain protein-like protein [Leptomonas pyrrhocoris]KPA83344.1 SH3 domain protein-like protein [Leptomonas pyrrhocoris]|eukprot:XP_015661783.1 SH3 domain protein-like protein [Leptomonas pyrrhocoris]